MWRKLVTMVTRDAFEPSERERLDVIVHDLRNLLTLINGNVELIRSCDDLSRLPRITARLTHVEQRGTVMIEQLSAMGAKAHAKRTPG